MIMTLGDFFEMCDPFSIVCEDEWVCGVMFILMYERLNDHDSGGFFGGAHFFLLFVKLSMKRTNWLNI